MDNNRRRVVRTPSADRSSASTLVSSSVRSSVETVETCVAKYSEELDLDPSKTPYKSPAPAVAAMYSTYAIGPAARTARDAASSTSSQQQQSPRLQYPSRSERTESRPHAPVPGARCHAGDRTWARPPRAEREDKTGGTKQTVSSKAKDLLKRSVSMLKRKTSRASASRKAGTTSSTAPPSTPPEAEATPSKPQFKPVYWNRPSPPTVEADRDPCDTGCHQARQVSFSSHAVDSPAAAAPGGTQGTEQPVSRFSVSSDGETAMGGGDKEVQGGLKSAFVHKVRRSMSMRLNPVLASSPTSSKASSDGRGVRIVGRKLTRKGELRRRNTVGSHSGMLSSSSAEARLTLAPFSPLGPAAAGHNRSKPSEDDIWEAWWNMNGGGEVK